jgi:hypothetical protein
MKISGTPGNCLAITPSGYWMRIATNCLEKGFSIQCDNDFKTNLLYEKETGGTIYVSPETHGAGANAWTTEKIIARCFKESGSCNYEASLWAASALYANGEDISEYGPYLRALAADNERYFPSAFLVAIYQGGDEYYSKIVDSERVRPEGAYWQMPSSPYGKFYDTSLAMLALGGADSPEINNAKTLGYLFENQDESGCWGGGNIRDTAFIIYAAQWPRSSQGTTGYCGDGTCGSGETSLNCLADCPLPQYVCGDGAVNGAEACDGTNLSLQNCTSKGFDGGTLRCTSNCTFNTSSCTSEVPFVPVCGDGMINGSEICDCGADGVCTSVELGGKSCALVGSYNGGTLGCATGCLMFNISQCYNYNDHPPNESSGENCTTNADCPVGEICRDGNCVNNETNDPYNPNNPTITDCELANLFCVPSMWACQDAGGNYFPQSTHACNNHLEYCCTVDVVEVTCTSLGGTVCPFDQPCTVSIKESGDGPCCVGGTCETGSSGCTSNDDCPAGKVCSLGECITQTSSECNDNEDCDEGEECKGGVCESVSTSGGSNLWIWIVVLLILIVLVVLGIVYRDKIRVWWYQFKGKAKSSKISPSGPPPGMIMARRPPPRFGPPAGMRPVMGGGPIIRPGMRPSPPAAQPAARSNKEKEDEETLKKLKEMSK